MVILNSRQRTSSHPQSCKRLTYFQYCLPTSSVLCGRKITSIESLRQSDIFELGEWRYRVDGVYRYFCHWFGWPNSTGRSARFDNRYRDVYIDSLLWNSELALCSGCGSSRWRHQFRLYERRYVRLAASAKLRKEQLWYFEGYPESLRSFGILSIEV